MNLPFQKSLGWVQRWFYSAEAGQLPTPQLSLDVSHDWPLKFEVTRDAYITTNGTVEALALTSDMGLVNPAEGGRRYHSIITDIHIRGNVNIPATDVVQLIWEPFGDLSGASIHEIILFDWPGTGGTNCRDIALVGGKFTDGIGHHTGIPPFYIQPGSVLFIRHQSTAGGITVNSEARGYRRESYLPLPRVW